MNELFDCANKENIKIYYQDTDSIHLKMKDLPTLVKRYEIDFNRVLIGNELCQFHSDFPQITKKLPKYGSFKNRGSKSQACVANSEDSMVLLIMRRFLVVVGLQLLSYQGFFFVHMVSYLL